MKKYLLYLESEGELKPTRIETDNFKFFVLEDMEGDRKIVKSVEGCVCCGIKEGVRVNG